MNEIERVERAAAKAAVARRKLEDAIRAARSAGVALRVVADAAGVSHEQVRRIADEDYIRLREQAVYERRLRHALTADEVPE